MFSDIVRRDKGSRGRTARCTTASRATADCATAWRAGVRSGGEGNGAVVTMSTPGDTTPAQRRMHPQRRRPGTGRAFVAGRPASGGAARRPGAVSPDLDALGVEVQQEALVPGHALGHRVGLAGGGVAHRVVGEGAEKARYASLAKRRR